MITLDDILFGGNREINQETILLPVAFQKYYCEMVFDVVDMANHDIVFGITTYRWYRENNQGSVRYTHYPTPKLKRLENIWQKTK